MKARHKDKGLESGIVAMIRLLLPPSIAASTLLVVAQLYLANVYGMASLPEIYHGLAAFAFVAVFFIFKEANHTEPPIDLDYIGNLGKAMTPWLIVICLLAVVGYSLKVSAEYSRGVLLTWATITPFLIAAGQLLFNRLELKRANSRRGGRTFVIAGVNELSHRLAESIKNRPGLGMSLLGYFDDRSSDRLGSVSKDSLLGSLPELPAFVKREQVDVIYVVLPMQHEERDRVHKLVDELQDTTASIYFVPDVFVFDLIQSRVDMIDGVPVLALCESPFVGINALTKRTTDLALASLILAAASPLMIVIALGIKFTTPGSVIFTQRRYGLDGREIGVYKFRTMTASDDGDAIPQAEPNDARTTRFGAFLRKYSLDELPQLINVLQGRMSLVGPRPHAVAHNEMYRKLIKGYMVRHKVTPGITGLAQVNGLRGETKTVEQMQARVAYDLEYLRSWSVALDLKIILKTIPLILNDRKAY